MNDHEHGPGCDPECCEAWQDEPPCDHDAHWWSSEGMGGCQENLGVWSLGGTTMLFLARCEHCGLRRREKLYGSQRNAFDCDERSFDYEGA